MNERQTQENAIDFSMLEPSQKQASALRNGFLAAGVLAVILLIVGIVAATIKENQRGTVMAVIGAVGFCVFACTVIRAMYNGFRRLRKQKQIFQNFAQKHGWKFDGENRAVSQDMIPKAWALDGNRMMQRFIIEGHWHNNKFAFYELVVPNVRAAEFVSILRKTSTPPRLNPKLADNLYCYQENGYDYFLKNGNAQSREDIQKMFHAASIST